MSISIVNARVWTGVPRRPWAEAVAIRGAHLVAVGSGAEIRKLAMPETRVIDAAGAMVVPGFIDAHVHFLDGGLRLDSVQLRDAATRAEFASRLAAFARTVPAGTWITGGDWDHERWGGELPHRRWIDDVTPDHPVFVGRLDGHMRLANTVALRAAGVTRNTPDVPGGTIVRDADGEPTGIMKDNAMAIVARAEPRPSADQEDRALDTAMRYVARQGVTSVHHMGSLRPDASWNDLAVLQRAHAAGGLRTRVYAAVPLASRERLRETIAEQGCGDAWLRIGAVKAFVDGSLGSHTAALHDPYADAPGDVGLLVVDPNELCSQIREADAAGLHPIVHAIGDRAIGLLLDIFERVARANGKRDRRFRVEHAQHLASIDVPRFAELGVIASMQPFHAIDDGRWAERVIGSDRIGLAFAWRSLLEAGATLAFGSDWFVAPPTPLEGIHAAVTRRTLDDRHPDGWVPEQRIGVEDALRAYTANAAFAEFGEREKGTLERGKLADLVVIDRDLTRVPPEAIRDARIEMTVVGGEVVYEGRD